MSLSVSEIFFSVQGEGRLAGVVSVFVRLAGCDLRCRWCDTPYSLSASQGERMSVGEVCGEVGKYDCRHVVVTGGEPMIAAEVPGLLAALAEQGRHVTVETSATSYRQISCNLVSVSPKLTNSIPLTGEYAQQREAHAARRLNIEAIQQYIDGYDYQLKFVVAEESDLAEVDEILGQLRGVNEDKIMLMPQAQSMAEYRRVGAEVVQMCLSRGWRYCPRLQIELWGGGRGR